jgi:hypothetical protein
MADHESRPFGIYIPNGPGACPSAAGIADGHLTTCTPMGRSPLLPQDIHPDDPWQFRNVLIH